MWYPFSEAKILVDSSSESVSGELNYSFSGTFPMVYLTRKSLKVRAKEYERRLWIDIIRLCLNRKMPSTDLPEPPEGWSEPVPYPESFWLKAKWLILLFFLAVVMYLPNIRDLMLSEPVSVITLVKQSLLLIITTAFVVGFLNVLIHEHVHKLVSQSLGYESKVRLRQIKRGKEPFNHIQNQWVDSNEYIPILLAPLFVINAISATLVMMDYHPIVDYIATSILVINTSTSGDDIRKFLLILREHRPMKVQHHLEDGGLRVLRTYKEGNSSESHAK